MKLPMNGKSSTNVAMHSVLLRQIVETETSFKYNYFRRPSYYLDSDDGRRKMESGRKHKVVKLLTNDIQKLPYYSMWRKRLQNI